MTAEDLDAIAATSGDDLFQVDPAAGRRRLQHAARTIGSLNDARGDTASINLRALGTGNTLVLLNGRRMVNHPGTQAENLVPVVTVNTNSIPTTGVEPDRGAARRRIGHLWRGRRGGRRQHRAEGRPRRLHRRADLWRRKTGPMRTSSRRRSSWASASDDGLTHLSVLGSYFTRDPIMAADRDFTANADLRSRLPAQWAADTTRRASSTIRRLPLRGGFRSVLRRARSWWADGTVTECRPGSSTSSRTRCRDGTCLWRQFAAANGLCIDDDVHARSSLRYNVNEPTSVTERR